MKIVLYFSILYGIAWLMHGALSHSIVTKSNTVQKSNASENRKSEYSFSESANLLDKVLIKSESPLRGRKIHQTAWSKEEHDEEKSQESKWSEKKTTKLNNSWSLENVLKYLISFVYETEETEQPTHVWITEDLLKDKLKEKINARNIETHTETEKNDDRISNDIQKNKRSKHSLMFKNGYLEDFRNFDRKREKSEKESDEYLENSYEHEDSIFSEEQVDENRIQYKNIKQLESIKIKNKFQDEEITDSEECFEDIDVSQNSQDEHEKTILTKSSTKSVGKEQYNEERIHKNKQEIISNKKHFEHKGTENIVEHINVEKDKENREIITLNGTQFTEENVKSVKKDKPDTRKSEFSNSENNTKEKTRKEIVIDENQEIQDHSQVHQEWAESTNSFQTVTKDEIRNSILEYNAKDNSNDTYENFKNSSTKLKPSKKEQGNNSLSETKQTSKNSNLQNKNAQTIQEGQNKELVINSNDAITDSQDINTAAIKIQPEILVLDDTKIEKTQQIFNEEKINNPVDLVLISAVDSSTKSQGLNETDAAIHEIYPEIFIIDDTKEKTQTYKEINDNPVVINTKESTSKLQDFNEDIATVLEIHPQILVMDDTRTEKTKEIFKEKTENPADLVVINSMDIKENTPTVPKIHTKILPIDDIKQGKPQIYNEEIINPILIKPIQENQIDMQNDENKELNLQNRILNIKIFEKNPVEENRKENYEGLLQQTSQSNSRISAGENNLQEHVPLNKHPGQVNEKPLTFKFKEDNAYEYILEGNEFIQLNEQQNNLRYAFDKQDYESKNKSELLTDSIITMLENIQDADDKQQENFDTILEFLYKHSNNPLILSLKENLDNSTT